MDTPPEPGRSRSLASLPRKRRRFSIWTILAPAAAIVLWVSFFSALGNSCIFKECKDTKAAAAEEETDKRNDIKRNGRTKVKAGDSLGSIAARFDLTEDELKACNPTVDPQSLQPGQFLTVSAANCENADQAAVGANPDPVAGETAPGATKTVPDPEANGTAAADPSAKNAGDAPPAADAAAEAGDEG